MRPSGIRLHSIQLNKSICRPNFRRFPAIPTTRAPTLNFSQRSHPTFIQSFLHPLTMTTTPYSTSTTTFTPNPQPPSPPPPMKIVLTELESEICKLLTNVTQRLQQTNPSLPPVTLRIAGGWVRDKLLGKESNDLDLAIDTMMGYEFANLVNEFLKSEGLPSKQVAKIGSNPEKSKHLETATCKVLGLDLDFVNLRTEEYSHDSRVPEIKFGTPLEDALRRDITINALFYNIHTHQVEDFTGKGLSDLENGIVRTPLQPVQTFLDDPLRILRVIRFASRFNYKILDGIWEAFKLEEVKTAFASKISRERIGDELNKMLKGPAPDLALYYIIRSGFFDLVFQPPKPEIVGDDAVSMKSISVLSEMIHSNVITKLLPSYSPSLTSEDIRVLYMTAALLPFAGKQYLAHPNKQKKEDYVTKYLIKDSVKLTNHDADTCTKVLCLLDSAKDTSLGVENMDRAKLGTRIREWGFRALMNKWFYVLILGCVNEFVTNTSVAVNSAEGMNIISKYERIIKRTQEMDLENCWDYRYLLDGKYLAGLFGMKPGPEVGAILQDVMEWQLMYPNGTVQECEEWLKTEFEGMPPRKKQRSC